MDVPGARLEGGDIVIDSDSGAFAGFLADPDRVILRFSGFDVIVPDEVAQSLLAALLERFG